MRRTQRRTSLAMVGAPRLTTAQHRVDVPRLHRVQRQPAQVRLDVLLDAAAHDVRVLPAAVDHALEVLVGELADGSDAARSLDAGQGGGLALLLLAGHVVAEGDLGAQLLGRLAGCCEGQIGVAAQVHHARLAGEAVAQLPARCTAFRSPVQHQTIAVGASFEVLAGPYPGPDGDIGPLVHRPPQVCTQNCPGRFRVRGWAHTNSGMGWGAVQRPDALRPRKRWTFRPLGGVK